MSTHDTEKKKNIVKELSPTIARSLAVINNVLSERKERKQSLRSLAMKSRVHNTRHCGGCSSDDFSIDERAVNHDNAQLN